MQSGFVGITANNRLKKTLHLEYAQRQASAHFPSPKIYTLNEWAHTSLEMACLRGDLKSDLLTDFLDTKILTTLEQAYIFGKIVKQSEREHALLSHKEIAKEAMKAWDLMQVYGVSSDELEGYFVSHELRRFRKWLAEYQNYCAENNCIDQTGVLCLLVECAQNLPTNEPLQIAGFDEINPLHQKIFSCFQVVELSSDTKCLQTKVASFNTIADEIRASALWATQIIAQKPKAKIGIIVPDLVNLREPLKEIFKSVLYPNQANLDLSNYIPLHNFSLGKPLGEYELIATALGWFAFLHSRDAYDFAELSILLNNPYCNHDAHDAFSRARFDWYVRENGKRKMNVADTLMQLQRFSSDEPWAKQLRLILEKAIQLKNSKKSLSFWLAYLDNLLLDLGFGNFYQTAISGQLLRGLKRAFDTAWQMSDVVGKTTASKACALVAQICQEQTFQFRTSDYAPIQIMGLLESNSQVFDFAWFIGADDHTLPLSSLPNAILPLGLQKARAMPRSSTDNELIYAKRTIARLQRASENLIFSYAKTNADGEANLPSGLLGGFDRYVPQTNGVADAPDTLIDTDKYESLIDAQGAPISTPHHLRAALKFFKAQAICPLMAYAVYRLGAADLPEPMEPFPPMERGKMVHEILDEIMQTDSPKDALAGVAESVVGEYARRINAEAKAMRLEINRTINLINDWLETVEDNRQVHQISALEREISAQINGLNFNMRIDRIDAIESGLLLIDYKTSSTVRTVGWWDERLSEPQLPMYACILEAAQNTPVAGVAFGQISTSSTKLAFIGDAPLCVTDKKYLSPDDWQTLKNRWKQQIDRLADEIQSGDARFIDTGDISPAAVGFCRAEEEIE